MRSKWITISAVIVTIHNNTIGLDLCFKPNTVFFLHPSFRIFYDSICYSYSNTIVLLDLLQRDGNSWNNAHPILLKLQVCVAVSGRIQQIPYPVVFPPSGRTPNRTGRFLEVPGRCHSGKEPSNAVPQIQELDSPPAAIDTSTFGLSKLEVRIKRWVLTWLKQPACRDGKCGIIFLGFLWQKTTSAGRNPPRPRY